MRKRIMGNFYSNLAIIRADENKIFLQEVDRNINLENNCFVIDINSKIYKEAKVVEFLLKTNNEEGLVKLNTIFEEVKQNNLNNNLDYVREEWSILEKDQIVLSKQDIDTTSTKDITRVEASNFVEFFESNKLNFHKSLNDFTSEEIKDDKALANFVVGSNCMVSLFKALEKEELDNFEFVSSNGCIHIKARAKNANKAYIIEEDVLKDLLQDKMYIDKVLEIEPNFLNTNFNNLSKEQEEKAKIINHISNNITNFCIDEDSNKIDEILVNLESLKEGVEFSEAFIKTILFPMEIPKELLDMGIDLSIDATGFNELTKLAIKTSFRVLEASLDPEKAITKKVKDFLKEEAKAELISTQNVDFSDSKKEENDNNNGLEL